MDYLQYGMGENFIGFINSFKPYYKWITFNIWKGTLKWVAITF